MTIDSKTASLFPAGAPEPTSGASLRLPAAVAITRILGPGSFGVSIDCPDGQRLVGFVAVTGEAAP